MVKGGQVIPLRARIAVSTFDAARHRMTAFLLDYSLIGSYAKFLAAGHAYPFTPADKVMPGLASVGIERHNSQAASGPKTPPVRVRNAATGASNSWEPATTPANTSEWPPKYLVASGPAGVWRGQNGNSKNPT